MTGELYFNGREWRNSGLNEQQVRFLELLYNRAGGSQVPTFDLSEISNIITNINESVTQTKAENDKLRRRINELENETGGYALEGHHLGGYL